jgi:alkylated DNA repair dioxygenase AlkB
MILTLQNLIPFDGEVYMWPGFFAPDESDRLLEAIIRNTLWKQEPINMFGRKVMQPRLTAWQSDPGISYTYSGTTMHPTPWAEELSIIKQKIEKVTANTFNSALLNYYRDGRDSMGWHRDNEKSLGTNPIIASVSFGAPRNFHLRHYTNKTLKIQVPLTHGSLLLMKGSVQHNWMHAILKEPKSSGPRINLTFRTVLF